MVSTDDYAELSGLFDDYCSDSMTQFPNGMCICHSFSLCKKDLSV